MSLYSDSNSPLEYRTSCEFNKRGAYRDRMRVTDFSASATCNQSASLKLTLAFFSTITDEIARNRRKCIALNILFYKKKSSCDVTKSVYFSGKKYSSLSFILLAYKCFSSKLQEASLYGFLIIIN